MSNGSISIPEVGVDVHCWSSAGVETCVTVKYKQHPLCVSFDMGYATAESVNSDHVFISHGHMDHISGIVQHASKRMLRRMPPATYYFPKHLAQHVRDFVGTCSEMCEKPHLLDQMLLKPMSVGDSVQLPTGCHRVTSFPTRHAVTSQGYIVYSTRNKLKREYEQLEQAHIQHLLSQGVNITSCTEQADIAYTGDTLFDVFTSGPPVADLLSVRLLIAEATYIERDRRSSVEKARGRGHCHLFEFRERADVFQHVGQILLMHFSDKYSRAQIERYVRQEAGLPASLLGKLIIGHHYFS